MKKHIIQLRNEFMDVVGSISVDELAHNQKVTQTIREIYQELTNGMETEEI
jgi:hypothetical protein